MYILINRIPRNSRLVDLGPTGLPRGSFVLRNFFIRKVMDGFPPPTPGEGARGWGDDRAREERLTSFGDRSLLRCVMLSQKYFNHRGHQSTFVPALRYLQAGIRRMADHSWLGNYGG